MTRPVALRRFAILVLLCCSQAITGEVAAWGSPRVLTEEFPYLTILTYVAPAAGTTVRFWTTDLSPGCDTVLHLVRTPGTGAGQFNLAYNDNYLRNSLASRIEYVMPAGLTRITVILRSKSSMTSGSATLMATKDGASFAGTPIYLAPVGGNIIPSTDFYAGWRDRMHTVRQAGGTEWTALALFKGKNWAYDELLALYTSGGASGGVAGQYLGEPIYDGILVGTPCSKLVTNGTIGCAGNLNNGLANIYFNDEWDSDADGLGDELEWDLGTCSHPYDGGGYWCYYDFVTSYRRAADTDNDGLTDGEEILGEPTPSNIDSGDLAYPLWGANPLHKDMFIEVDYYNPTNTNPFAGEPTMLLAEAIAAAFGEGTAESLENPDGEPGVAVHFDLGVPWTGSGVPPGTLVGDYGSNSARFSGGMGRWTVTKKCVGWVRFNGPNCQSVALDCAGFNGIEGQADALKDAIESSCAANAWLVSVSDDTTVLVEEDPPLGLGTLGIAGQPGGHAVECAATANGPWVACPGQEVEVSTHDNDALRNHYNNTNYVDANRVGHFYYAVGIDNGSGQALTIDDYGRTVVFNAQNEEWSAYIMAHEMGHLVGLRHTGNASAKGWTNCAPNYPSIMSYSSAYDIMQGGFYENELGVQLNPSNVDETVPLPAYLTDLMQGNGWWYVVFGGGGVDWNRNENPDVMGAFQSPIYMGAGPQSCNAFGGGVQALVGNGMFLDEGTGATGQPDLSHVYGQGFDRMAVFYTDDGGQILYRTAALGLVANSSCFLAGTDKGIDSNCLTFEPQTALPLPAANNARGVSSLWYGSRLFIAYVTRDNAQLWIRRYWYNSGTNNFVELPGESFSFAIASCGLPELQFLWTGQLVPKVMVAFCDNDALGSVYKFGTWNSATLQWSPFYPVLDAVTNLQYAGPGSPGSVAWPDVRNQAMPAATRQTCLLLPQDDPVAGSILRFICRAPEVPGFPTGFWRDMTALSFPQKIVPAPANDWCRGHWAVVGDRCLPHTVDNTKPELAFVPLRLANGSVHGLATGLGRLFLVYPRPDPDIPVPDVFVSDYIYASPAAGVPGRPIGVSPLWGGVQAKYMVDDFINEWADLQESTNLALYSDSSIGGAMAVGAFRTEHGKLNFYPHADGTPNQPYQPVSDFLTMRYGVCLGVTGKDYNRCEKEN